MNRSRSIFPFASRGVWVASLLAGAALLVEFAGAQTPTASERAARAKALKALPKRVGPIGVIDPSPIPTGWTCVGNCGTDSLDGVVTLSPFGSAKYAWVSTNGGTNGVGALPSGALGSETNGSTLATSVFAATAGSQLKFYFNYVTSDGSGFADYAWAELYSSTNTPVALLFTARTVPSGSIIPGTGLPSPLATLSPASVPIIGGAPTWLPLGGSSNTCYAAGCGYTGWVSSTYTIATTGNYYLKVGAVNWSDTNYDSGLAMDGVTIGGVAITTGTPPGTPAPSSLILTMLGLAAVGIYLALKMRAVRA